MTADKLKQIVDYGTGEQLRAAVAHALTELEAKAAREVSGKVPTGDVLLDFLTDVTAKATALVTPLE